MSYQRVRRPVARRILNRISVLRRGALFSLAGCMSIAALACAVPLGGWDVARLIEQEPELAGIRVHRFGDLIPFPFPHEGGVALVTCRWPTGEPIRVSLRLTGERRRWAQAALESLDRGHPAVAFEISDAVLDSSPADSAITVNEVEASGGSGPTGVGDTLVACDASESVHAKRGTLIRAQVEMRVAVVNPLDERVPVVDEEWTGAFMHELGHALGFQGHPKSGGSVMRRDESRLRRAGRAALAGEVWTDPLLGALYQLDAGRALGHRDLSRTSRDWLAMIRGRVGHAWAPIARVGDRHSDLEWQTSDGVVLRLRFPFWARQLRAGEEVIAIPDPETRKALLGASR